LSLLLWEEKEYPSEFLFMIPSNHGYSCSVNLISFQVKYYEKNRN